jgi:ketosteroid isomerase-like protein
MLGPSDLAEIRELERRWLACELAGRAFEVLELCAPEVVWLPPGLPALRGKAAIHAWLESSNDRVEYISLTDGTIEGADATAYKIANFETRYVPAGATAAVTIHGWHLWVLRRGESGWQVAVVAWSVVSPNGPRPIR